MKNKFLFLFLLVVTLNFIFADTECVGEGCSVSISLNVQQISNPIISNVSSTLITSSEAVIIWQTDNLTNSTVYYGTAVPLVLSSDSLTLVISHLVRLSSLSSSTLYYYNVSSCDSVGNCNTSMQFNFTTLEAASAISNSGSSNGGGSSGGGTIDLSVDDGDLSVMEKILGKGAKILFKLDKEIHSMKIINIDNTSVTIEISSTPQQAVLIIGEERKFEINDDNYYDILVRLNEIKNNKANLTISGIHEELIKQLFDITFNLVDKSIESVSELVAVVTFESFGTEPTPVKLLFTILDENGNEVHSEEDQITVETEEILRRTFGGVELVEGKYTLILTTLYNVNVVDEFRQEFEILGTKTDKISQEFKENFLIYGSILFLIITVLLILMVIIIVKLRKESIIEKRGRELRLGGLRIK